MDPLSFAQIIHHVALADFAPVEVRAFPGPGGHARAGDGPCGLQFQFFDPSRGVFVDYFLATGASAELDDRTHLFLGDVSMVPPNDESFWSLDFDVFTGPPILPGNARGLLGDSPWRVVDEHDAVVMTFDGPYAVNARELQTRIGEGASYESDRHAPGCNPTPEHECWTALEVWVQLEDWKDAHCASRAGSADE